LQGARLLFEHLNFDDFPGSIPSIATFAISSSEFDRNSARVPGLGCDGSDATVAE